MTVGALIVIAVLVLLFMTVVAGLVLLGIKLYGQLQTSFFSEIRQLNASHAAERSEQQETYAKFLELQEEREQVIAAADGEWIKSPDSEVVMDDDLNWEMP